MTGFRATFDVKAVGWSTFISLGTLGALKSKPDKRSRLVDLTTVGLGGVAIGSTELGIFEETGFRG